MLFRLFLVMLVLAGIFGCLFLAMAGADELDNNESLADIGNDFHKGARWLDVVACRAELAFGGYALNSSNISGCLASKGY